MISPASDPDESDAFSVDCHARIRRSSGSALRSFLERIKTVHVRHQDDFFHHGVKTLHMLEEEIKKSDFVVHIIGAEPGWSPPVDQVEAFP